MKMVFYIRVLLSIGAILLLACHQPTTLAPPVKRTYPIVSPTDQQVQIRGEQEGFQLWVDEEPFEVMGVAGRSHFARLADMGGNTIRTYTTEEAGSILDSAQIYGLKVILGLYLMPGEKGFDYNNPDQVSQQLTWVRKEVEQYKDHPALLMWGLGNELELHYDEPAVWAAINQTAELIHEIDPDHPTISIVLGNEASIRSAARELPQVDILGINTFQAIDRLSRFMKQDPYAWQGPYVFTEWGYRGPWEAELTAWKAPIEESSAFKAQLIEDRIAGIQAGPTQRLIGSCAFYWGEEHVERTHTWFNLLGPGGKSTAMSRAVQQFWGQKPDSAMPFQVDSIHLDGKNPFYLVYLEAGQSYEAEIFLSGQLPDSLEIQWELLPESPMENNIWLDPEPKPEPLTGLWEGGSAPTLFLKAPAEVGAYRLFCYVQDGSHWGSANVPFWVAKMVP